MNALKYYGGHLFAILVFSFIPYKEYLNNTGSTTFIGDSWFSIAYVLTWIYIFLYILINIGLITYKADNLKEFNKKIIEQSKGREPYSKISVLPYIISMLVGIQYDVSYVYIFACLIAAYTQWHSLKCWNNAYESHLVEEAKKGSVYEEKHLS